MDDEPSGPGAVEAATRAQLEQLRISPEADGRAATAVVMAHLLDTGPAARDAAAIAGQLRGALAELVKQAALSPAPSASPLDELLARRKARGA